MKIGTDCKDSKKKEKEKEQCNKNGQKPQYFTEIVRFLTLFLRFSIVSSLKIKKHSDTKAQDAGDRCHKHLENRMGTWT